MAFFILKPKLPNRTDFSSKNVNKEATKEVIFFFKVVFCPMIHNVY